MAKYLVIVESPAKVKTIKKFLGSSYVVTASNGHVRDLPKSTLGIDVEHDFEPKYITIRGKGDIRMFVPKPDLYRHIQSLLKLQLRNHLLSTHSSLYNQSYAPTG